MLKVRASNWRRAFWPPHDIKENQMKFVRKIARVYPLLGLLVLLSLLAGCTKAVPDFAATAPMTKYDNLRAMEYCEVFLIGGNPITKNLKAAVYNTSYLNNQSNPLVTCPADLWAKIDPERLKKQYDMLGIFKNGPRMWVNDWIQIPIAQDVTTFDGGLQTHWFMTVSLPKDMEVGKKGSTAYKPTIGHRNSVMGFVAGKPVFLLDDPDGNTWVMQASAQIVDPNLTYERLADLGSKLQLPTGWKFRVTVLDRDLNIKAINGDAWIVQDDLENTYDKCFEEAGQTACSFKP
jgi:hypothetical protein